MAVVLAILPFALGMSEPPAVHPLFDLGRIESAPFPSNEFTAAAPANVTGLRIDLPLPDCEQRRSDCDDITVLNTLDGFNVQPRLSIPFDGPIDVSSVSSDTVFLLRLACPHDSGSCDEGPAPEKVGINQVVWDALTNTLHVESDQLLDQHTRYALIITRGVHDRSGAPIAPSPAFVAFRQTVRGGYKDALLDGLHAARKAGVPTDGIAVASVFTTQSVTSVLERIRDQIKSSSPSITDFRLAADGSRTVFPLQNVASVSWNQQTRTTVPLNPPVTFTLADLRSIPGAVGHVAFGRFLARDYQLHPGEFIPSTSMPAGSRDDLIYFNLVLPAGTPPVNGWPVAIAGHGGGTSKEPFTVGPAGSLATTLARHGIATIAINAVGHGFGALGSLTVTRATGEPVSFPSGGRGFDQNGDGLIEPREGMKTAAPRTIIDDRDGLRQTVADLMQLVRQIEGGVDVDDDSIPDLDPSRIYFVCQSLGGVYGSVFLAIEPRVNAGVLTVAGGPRTSRTLTRGDRGLVGTALGMRSPSLLNDPGVTHLEDVAVLAPTYNENVPLRDGEALNVRFSDGTTGTIQSPVVNSTPGAMDIQEYLDRTEWVMQSANPVAYAPYLRRRPLQGMLAKRVIVQFARGDQSMPNPATSAMVRAGGLEDRTTFYRHDLAFAENPALPRDPHPFMPLPAQFGAIARGAQEQIAVFLASDGEITIHPEPRRFFEVPIVGALPEGLNFVR